VDRRQLFDSLVAAEKLEDARFAFETYRAEHKVAEVPFGGRPNNRGAIEVAADAARSEKLRRLGLAYRKKMACPGLHRRNVKTYR
jgi:hypothetical protein